MRSGLRWLTPAGYRTKTAKSAQLIMYCLCGNEHLPDEDLEKLHLRFFVAVFNMSASSAFIIQTASLDGYNDMCVLDV